MSALTTLGNSGVKTCVHRGSTPPPDLHSVMRGLKKVYRSLVVLNIIIMMFSVYKAQHTICSKRCIIKIKLLIVCYKNCTNYLNVEIVKLVILKLLITHCI